MTINKQNQKIKQLGLPVKILWCSQHEPIRAQVEELEKRLGEIEFVLYKLGVPNAQYVIDLVKEEGAEYLIAILPLSFIQKIVTGLKNTECKLLRSSMINLHTCYDKCNQFNKNTDVLVHNKNGSFRHYRFLKYEILQDVVFITDDL